MEKIYTQNLEALIDKKVKVYDIDGLMKAGILKSRKNNILPLLAKSTKRSDKIILANLNNISFIEEQ